MPLLQRNPASLRRKCPADPPAASGRVRPNQGLTHARLTRPSGDVVVPARYGPPSKSIQRTNPSAKPIGFAAAPIRPWARCTSSRAAVGAHHHAPSRQNAPWEPKACSRLPPGGRWLQAGGGRTYVENGGRPGEAGCARTYSTWPGRLVACLLAAWRAHRLARRMALRAGVVRSLVAVARAEATGHRRSRRRAQGCGREQCLYATAQLLSP